MTRLPFSTVCALICALAVLAPGCGHSRRTPDGSGTVEATRVQISAKVPGQILGMYVEEGSAVAPGDSLALIDPVDYELRLDGARAALEQASAQRDLVIAGARDENIEQARSRVREAQAAATLAEANYARATRLFENESIAQQQLEEATAGFESSAAALSAAQEGLSMLLRGSREQEIQISQARVDQARAHVSLAARAVADCRVTSPVDGTVTIKVSEPGEMARAGTPIVVVSRLDRVWLSIYIPETRLSEVTLGDSAYVTIDGDGSVFGGAISFISPEAEFTPRDVQTPDERTKLVYRVKIELDNPDGTFKPGMPADGYIGTRP